MSNFVIRTEELTEDEISKFYVADREDDEIFSKLKSPSPVLLIGSRGVGKTFLFKVSENRLKTTFSEDRILPVFITFRDRKSVV